MNIHFTRFVFKLIIVLIASAWAGNYLASSGILLSLPRIMQLVVMFGVGGGIALLIHWATEASFRSLETKDDDDVEEPEFYDGEPDWNAGAGDDDARASETER